MLSKQSNAAAVAAAGLLLASAASADPLGTAFTYQGQLKLNGTLVDDTCDCQFTLWNHAVSTNAVNQVGPTLTFDGQGGNPPPIAVVDGLLTVELDFGAGVFDGNARWLDIAFACPPGGALQTLAPRQALTPVPYALHAASGAGGTLALPFTGSFAGSDQAALTITQTGVGYAAEFRSTDDGNYWGTLGLSSTGTGASLFAINSGGGPVARLQNTSQPNNIFPTLHATTFGSAAAVLGDAGVGTNGTGVSGVGQGTGHGVRGSAAGTGFAGFFTGRGHFGGDLAVGTSTPRQQLSVGAHVDIYSGAINSPTRPSIRGSSGNNLTLNATGNGAVFINHDSGTGGVRFHNGTTGTAGELARLTGDGRLGIGTTGPTAKLDVRTSSGSAVTADTTDPNGWAGTFGGLTAGKGVFVLGESHLFGGVGIGTTTVPTGVQLAVNGKVLCEELEVQLSQDWPDYVFEEGYELLPLEELEEQIRRQKHLPGIPSAQQVAEEGLAVGAMQAKLLEKVEELTLYVIEVNRELKSVKDENVMLRERVARLESERREP